MQVISSSAEYVQRAQWLINSTELATLSQIELSRLIAALQPVQYQEGDVIFKEGEPTDLVVLFESGLAELKTSRDLAREKIQAYMPSASGSSDGSVNGSAASSTRSARRNSVARPDTAMMDNYLGLCRPRYRTVPMIQFKIL